MALVLQDQSFQHILRISNTNIHGHIKVMYAMTGIKGIGRRFSNLVLKKADIDVKKRAGELSNEEIDRIMTVIQHPRQYKIPAWFLNRRKDIKDGKNSQLFSTTLDTKLREDLERLKKIKAHRGLRHYWGLRVRGQHTKTTGRRGRTIGHWTTPFDSFSVRRSSQLLWPTRLWQGLHSSTCLWTKLLFQRP